MRTRLTWWTHLSQILPTVDDTVCPGSSVLGCPDPLSVISDAWPFAPWSHAVPSYHSGCLPRTILPEVDFVPARLASACALPAGVSDCAIIHGCQQPSNHPLISTFDCQHLSTLGHIQMTCSPPVCQISFVGGLFNSIDVDFAIIVAGDVKRGSCTCLNSYKMIAKWESKVHNCTLQNGRLSSYQVHTLVLVLVLALQKDNNM